MKRKSILTLLGTTTLLSSMAFVATPNVAAVASPAQQNIRLLSNASQAKIVTAKGLNVRAKASMNGAKLGVLPKGAKVNVIGQEGNWSKIMFNGKTAFVSSNYLANSNSSAPKVAAKSETKMVTAKGLNVRAKASMNGAKLGVLPKGAKVNVIGQEGNWSKIMFNGKTAFVSSQYLANSNSSAPKVAAKSETKMVTAKGLNVRAKASMNGTKLGVLPKGAKVKVIGQEGNWSKIMFNGKTAFVSSKYLANSNSSAPKAEAKVTTKMVTAKGLNVRAKASMNGAKLGVLPKGAKVNVLGQEGNWSKIMFNGKTAFVSTQYLK